jgi:outer membrane protein assembly factor BamE (lipoprotein component of BamABCDE complex)
MKRQLMELRKVSTAVYAALLLVAASNVTAEEASIEFPDLNSAYLKEGTFVSIENLRNVGPGLTKNQMYELLGPPHFHEGVFNVRVWNYIFNFKQGGSVVTCQYQVQYTENKTVDSTYWDRPECADFLK